MAGWLAADLAVRKVLFINAVGEEDAGYGWDVQFTHRGEMWHVQMWLLPSGYDGPRSSDLAPAMNQALDDTSRCAILRIKEYLIGQRKWYRSIDVYRAVLDFGIDNGRDYEKWAPSHSSARLIAWRPGLVRGRPHGRCSHPVGSDDP